MAKEAPDYSVDPHLSPAVKAFLTPLNAAGPSVESLSEQDARNVLINLQASVKVDLSGIDESEKTITQDGYTVKLTIVRPKGNKKKLPLFIFTHGGGWVLGDYPTHKRLVRDLVVASGMLLFLSIIHFHPKHIIRRLSMKFTQRPNGFRNMVMKSM